jgi:hypothetical protein
MSCSDKDFEKTFFLFGAGIPENVKSNFKNSYQIPYYDKRKGLLKKKFFRILFYYRYIKFYIIPHWKKLELYVNDHLEPCPIIIGKKNYTLLEDGPHSNVAFEGGFLDKRDQDTRKMRLFKIRQFIYGPTFGYSFGRNKQCTDLLLGYMDDTEFIKSKKCHLIDFKKEWDSCSEEKKQFILSMFDLTDEDLNFLKRYPIVLFTQPFYKRFTSKEEHARIYKAIAQKYPKDKLIIKPHPRDDFDYEQILPGYAVFRKKVSSQMLEILNVKWDRAITVCSSSVFEFNYPIEKDWYGVDCSPMLKRKLGESVITPNDVNLCSL